MTTALGVLILLAVAVGAVYVLFRPQFALVLVLTLHPLKQLLQSYLPAFAQQSSLFNFIVFGIVVLAVMARLVRRDRAFSGYINPVSISIWLLYAIAMFGLLHTPSPEAARDLVKSGAPYWLMSVLLLPLVVVTMEDFRKVLPAFMVVGTTICLLFFVNPSASFYAGRLTIDLGQAIGVADWRGNPLITATMGAQVAMVAMLLRPVRPSVIFNGLRIAAIVAGFGLAVASGSRGNVLLAVLVGLAFFPLARQVANVKQFALTSTGFVILAGMVMLTFRLFLGRDIGQQARWDVSRWDQPVQVRIQSMVDLAEAFMSDPLRWPLGLGTNAYTYISGREHGYAHNLLVEVLFEQGLIGMGLLLIAFIGTLVLGRSLWRSYADDPPQRAVAAALLALCAYLFLLYMKQSTFTVTPDLFAIWVLMAKIATHERRTLAWPEHAYDPYDDETYEYEYSDFDGDEDDTHGTAPSPAPV